MRGVLVARMLGVAIIVLGLTWWMARGNTRLVRPGFLVYNVAVGLLFGWAALGASSPIVPWSICMAHLVAAMAITVLGARPTVS